MRRAGALLIALGLTIGSAGVASAATAPEIPSDIAETLSGRQCGESGLPAWFLPCNDSQPPAEWGPRTGDGKVDRAAQREMIAAATGSPAPSASPSAAPGIPQDPGDLPTDEEDKSIKDRLDDLDHATGADKLFEFCPDVDPPTPQFANLYAAINEGVGVDTKEGRNGSQAAANTSLFSQYGYAGLYMTTLKQGCMVQIQAGGKRTVNEVANSIDELVNNAQMGSQSPGQTDQMDKVLPDALVALKEAFWAEWMPVAAIFVGILIVIAGLMMRSGTMIGLAANMVLVMAVVPFVLSNSTMFTRASDAMTVGVASRTSEVLMNLTPGGAPAGATNALGEGYYMIAYRAWLDASCLSADAAAASEFGPRFVASQAWSFKEIEAGDHLKEDKIKAKGDAWLAAAADLEDRFPAIYDCWSQGGQESWSVVFKHLIVSVFAGFWILVFALAVLALRFMLRFGFIILGAYAIAMLVMGKMTTKFVNFMATGIFGPPMVSMLMSGLMFWFYIVVSSPEIAWWGAIVNGVGLGLAALLSMGFLASSIFGFAVASRYGYRRRRRTLRSRWGSTRSAAAGAAGAAAGARAGSRGSGAAGKAAAGATGGSRVDARRHEEPDLVGGGKTGGKTRKTSSTADAGSSADPVEVLSEGGKAGRGEGGSEADGGVGPRGGGSVDGESKYPYDWSADGRDWPDDDDFDPYDGSLGRRGRTQPEKPDAYWSDVEVDGRSAEEEIMEPKATGGWTATDGGSVHSDGRRSSLPPRQAHGADVMGRRLLDDQMNRAGRGVDEGVDESE